MLHYFVVAVPVAAVSAWLAMVAVILATTRPPTVHPAPATAELGPEPPAVVNLLTNRWRVTIDAAEATLLDLAARRVLELRQADDNPARTTIHVRGGNPGQLRPYEQKVLERVRALAIDGTVPVHALAFRNRALAWSWARSLRRMVVEEARHRGLSRRRLSERTLDALRVAGLLAGLSGTWHTAPPSVSPAPPAPWSTWDWATCAACGRRTAAGGDECASATPGSGHITASKQSTWARSLQSYWGWPCLSRVGRHRTRPVTGHSSASRLRPAYTAPTSWCGACGTGRLLVSSPARCCCRGRGAHSGFQWRLSTTWWWMTARRITPLPGR